ncbi:MAG: WD40 repeat domain-containing protein [Patescibacteria group bacterium]|nr:WD40 repeat domain-containing protein [Patescibacteria group bacterium]
MNIPDLNYKKIILIIGFIFTSLFFAFLIYSFFFKDFVSVDKNTNYEIIPVNDVGRNYNTNGRLYNKNANKNASLQAEKKDKDTDKKINEIKKISESIVKGITMNLNGDKLVYYNKNDGKFYAIDKNGESILMSEKTFYDVQNITWSPNKDKAVLEYPDGSNIVYNFTTDKQTTLPKNWEEFSFSLDNKQIITKNFSSYSENNHLIIADINSGRSKIIENLGNKAGNFQLAWSPDNQVVAFFIEPVDFDHQEIYLIGQHNENFKSIIVEGYGFQGKWNLKGDKILYSVYNNKNNYEPALWIATKHGTYKKRIYLNTWAEKCSFYNNNIIYCGVPQYLEEMMGINPNYAIDINDDIYKIDLNKNSIEKIITTERNVEKIMVDNSEKTLYFIDRRTGRLYQIDL